MDEVAERVAQKLRPLLTANRDASDSVLYTVEEAAGVLHISKRALQNMIQRQQIAVIRHGRRVRIHKRDIDSYLAEHRV